MENLFFRDITADGDAFFGLLPPDWRSEVAPIWPTLKNTTKIYGVYSDNTLIAGGLVFSAVSPDMEYAHDYAQQWHDNQYHYIGFLWVAPEYRSLKVGSFWLKHLFLLKRGQKFWLTVEDEGLVSFYQKNGFTLETSLQNHENTEWVLKFEP